MCHSPTTRQILRAVGSTHIRSGIMCHSPTFMLVTLATHGMLPNSTKHGMLASWNVAFPLMSMKVQNNETSGNVSTLM